MVSAETHIHPVIVDRTTLENVFVKSTCDNDSNKSTEIITSDLEDGYLGNKRTVKVDSPSPVPEIDTPSKKVEKEIIIEDYKTSRLLITRSDSFHTFEQKRRQDELPRVGPYSPPKRSTSFLSMQRHELSLNRAEKIDNTPYRRKSSSELSICDTPSLQSIEIIKNILNSSRKSSSQDVVVPPAPVKEEPEEPESEIESLIERAEIVKQELKIVSKKLEHEFDDMKKTTNTTTISNKKIVEEEKVKEIADATEIEPVIIGIATKSPENVESVKSENENSKADVVAVKLETETVRQQSEEASRKTEAQVMKRETSTSSNESIKAEHSQHKPQIVAEKPKQVSSSEPPKQNEKPVEKQWKYTGPPKINFSTWNERPKVDVAIADDKDYKRSGTISPTPRENSHAPQANKRHTIHFGADKIQVQTYTAKPRVLGVELKREPVVENFNKVPLKSVTSVKPRPINSDVNKSPTSPDITFNNFISNAKKLSPIVHGFEKPVEKKSPPLERTIEIKSTVQPPIVPLKPSFLRTSSESTAKNVRFSKPEEAYQDIGFSQNSLKKTGLKEKILTDDSKKESIFGRVMEEMTTKQREINDMHNSRPFSVPPPPKPPALPNNFNKNTFKKSASMNETESRSQLLDAIKTFNRDSLRNK